MTVLENDVELTSRLLHTQFRNLAQLI